MTDVQTTSPADAVAAVTDPTQDIAGRSLWQDAWRRLRANRAALTAVALLSVMTLLVLFGPMLSPYDFDYTDWDNVSVAPSFASGHYFGTDFVGRDLFVRTLEGGRISLLIGVVATLVSLVIGISWGATAGYLGGRIDNVMMRIVDILYAMPFMFLSLIHISEPTRPY